jgi:hypothetical protein
MRSKHLSIYCRFYVLKPVVIFWWPCSSVKVNRRFGGTSPQTLGSKNKPSKIPAWKHVASRASASFNLHLNSGPHPPHNKHVLLSTVTINSWHSRGAYQAVRYTDRHCTAASAGCSLWASLPREYPRTIWQVYSIPCEGWQTDAKLQGHQLHSGQVSRGGAQYLQRDTRIAWSMGREATETELRPNSMDREECVCISKSWKPLVSSLKDRSKPPSHDSIFRFYAGPRGPCTTPLCGHLPASTLMSHLLSLPQLPHLSSRICDTHLTCRLPAPVLSCPVLSCPVLSCLDQLNRPSSGLS